MRHDSLATIAPPAGAWEFASRIAATQPAVPRSPVETVDGRLTLCAAACLATAGLYLYVSPEDAARFEDELGESRSFALVIDAFDRLGWDRRYCLNALQFNDSRTPRHRKSEVVDYLAAGDPGPSGLAD